MIHWSLPHAAKIFPCGQWETFNSSRLSNPYTCRQIRSSLFHVYVSSQPIMVINNWISEHQFQWDFNGNSQFSSNKMHFKMSSSTYRQFCFDPNVLIHLLIVYCKITNKLPVRDVNKGVMKLIRKINDGCVLSLPSWTSVAWGKVNLAWAIAFSKSL